jgi:RAB protein geranylgeranyltransferase component A
LEELVQWAKDRSSSDSEQTDAYWGIQRTKITSISQSASTFPQSRQYSLSLAPSLIPSVGPMIASLVSSGVARYGGYRLVERVGAYDSSGVVKTVPGSKEDVFKNKDISLVDKRRLMRFLMFAAGNFEDKKELEGKADAPFLDFLRTVFSLNEEIAGVITYSLAYCASASGDYSF